MPSRSQGAVSQLSDKAICRQIRAFSRELNALTMWHSHDQGSPSRLQPTIQCDPWTASRRNITPTHHCRDRTQFGAIWIANPTRNDMRDSKPSGCDGQRPRDRRNRHAKRNPCQHEPCEPHDRSRQPLTARDCVRRPCSLANRALGTVRHLHGRPHRISVVALLILFPTNAL